MFAASCNLARNSIVLHKHKTDFLINMTCCLPILHLALLVTAHLQINVINTLIDDCKIKHELKEERANPKVFAPIIQIGSKPFDPHAASALHL